ncbi:MAG: copper chaperone PCu(A)C [Chloroflexota bacterium]
MDFRKLCVMLIVMLFVAACGTPATTTDGEADADTAAEGETGADTTSAEVTAGSITVSDMWARPSLAMMGEMDHGGEGEMDHGGEGEMDHGGEGEMDHGGEGEMDHGGEGEMDHGGEGEMDHAEGMSHGGNNGAAYMIINNSGEEVDRLVSASSDVAETIELHTVEEGDGGVMAMRQVENIEVPAGGETTLEPGGFHVMLIGLTQDLTAGDTFNVTLEFETAGTMDVEVEVREM